MQCIKRDESAGRDTEFGEQCLSGGDLVGFLLDVDVGEHQGGVGGERAQHLCGGAIMESVEAAAERFTIQRDGAPSTAPAGCLQQGSMAAERPLHRRRVEPLQDVADGGVGGCPPPLQAERRIQSAPMHVDEGHNAPIRVAACHHGEDGEQQHMGQLVELAFRATRVGNLRQNFQQRREPSHGNLRLGCRSKSQSPADFGNPPTPCQSHFPPDLWPIELTPGHTGALNSRALCSDVAVEHMERTFTNVDSITLVAFYMPTSLGTIYRFSQTGIPREFLIFDWSKPETGPAWIDGPKGGLLFHLDPTEGLIEEMNVHIGILESLLPREPNVSITLNGNLLAVWCMSASYDTVNVSVPPEMRSDTGLYQLEIECDQRGKAPGDTRDLSISVSEFVCWGSKPENNIAVVAATEDSVAKPEDRVVAAVPPKAEPIEATDLPLQAKFNWENELDYSGFYHQEVDREGKPFRWIGPEPKAVLTMPRVQVPGEIRIYVANVFNWEIMSQVQVSVDGGPPVAARVENEGERRVLVAVIAEDNVSWAEGMRVEINTIKTRSPSELGLSDRRRFSLAIELIEARTLVGNTSDVPAVDAG